MKKIKIISKIVEIYRPRHQFCNIPYIMKQENMANVEVPKMGDMVECEYAGHRFKLFRMPSSSRAYPLALEKKAEAYCKMFRQLGYEI